MPQRLLPQNPSLDRLQRLAKHLRKSVHAGDPDSVALVREFHPRAEEPLSSFTLADAQLALARAYRFASWANLTQHLVEIEPFVWHAPRPPDPQERAHVFIRVACLTYTDLHPAPDRATRILAEDPEVARTNVYTAAAAGDVEVLATMLDDNPGLLNRKGGPLQWAPLLYACYSRVRPTDSMHSTLEAARLLLARGADPNAGFLYDGTYAFTALTGAFGRGEDWPNQPPHPECTALARLLLDAGADPNDAQTLYNRHFQPDDEHLEILFAYGLGRNRRGPWSTRLREEAATLLATELGWAVQHGCFNRVRLLVGHGVDVNVRSPRTGRTPYEEALRSGRRAIAEYLLQQGATKVDLDPLEAFAIACIAGQRDEVRARLTADPTLLDRLGHERRIDMLHRAVDAGSEPGIRLIVDLGVDIDGTVPGTGYDRTVLHNAAGWKDVQMVKLLVELGADPRLRDLAYHSTALGWALYNRNAPAVVEYLLQFATIFEAVHSGAIARVAALLREDPALINARDASGRSPVFYLNPHEPAPHEMLRLLVDHGSDLGARDDEGWSLVERARASGRTEFADFLRAHGAS
jgi:ankyrin repeat protein